MNKIIEQFNSLNDQIRYGIFGGVVFIIVLADVFLLLLPQWGAIDNINQQITQMTQDTQEVLTDKQRVALLKKNLQDLRVQEKALSDKVRPVQEVPAILGIISNVANEYGVKIDQLGPDKAHQEALKKTFEGQYYALPITVKARCGYHMFGRFLNKLEKEDMFFIIKDFIIQTQGSDVNNHMFSLTINLIVEDRFGPAA